jgi:hypothetical protein
MREFFRQLGELRLGQLKWLFIGMAIGFIVFTVAFSLAGCGEDVPEGAGCVGTVTKTYTEYKPGVSVVSGNLSIPTGSTRYYIAVQKSDGTYCSRKLDKDEWLGISEGDTYG